MINKKINKKGFTLAEMMISMLIVSLILAAIMPTVVKSVKKDRDHIWKWAQDGTSVYFERTNSGGNQGLFKYKDENGQNIFYNENKNVVNDNARGSLYVGLAVVPQYRSDILSQGNIVYDSDLEADELHLDPKPIPKLDGQVGIYTSNMSGHPLVLSHIDLYEKDFENTKPLTYNGRIAADDYNVAFGIGTLQKAMIGEGAEVDPVTGKPRLILPKYNTSVGQISMYNNTIGSGNTAIGYNAVGNNTTGKYNTAVGANAGNNTGIGTGSNNTYVGGMSGPANNPNPQTEPRQTGSQNTVIGAFACRDLLVDANRNICIGYNAGGKLSADHPDENQDRIFIGSDNSDRFRNEASTYVPLISGQMNYQYTYSPALINFNLKTFKINLDDGGREDNKSMHTFTVRRGADGYEEESDDKDYYFGETESVYARNVSSDPRIKNAYIKTYVDEKKPEVVRIDFNDMHDMHTNRQLIINNKLFITTDANSLQSSIGGGRYFNLKADDAQILFGTNSADQSYVEFKKGLIEGESVSPFGINAENDLFIGRDPFSTSPLNITIEGKTINIESEADDFTINSNINQETTGMSAQTINIKDKLSVCGVETPGNCVILDGKDRTITLNKNGVTNISLDAESGVARAQDLERSGSGSEHSASHELQGIKQGIEDLKRSISDIRLKNVTGNNENGLEEINRLQIKNYTYKDDKKKEPHVGVIAQDLQKIFPNSVFKDKDGYFRIKTEEMFYSLINSVKQLFVKIQNLQNKIFDMEKSLSDMEDDTEMIKTKNKTIEQRLRKLEQKENIRSGRYE